MDELPGLSGLALPAARVAQEESKRVCWVLASHVLSLTKDHSMRIHINDYIATKNGHMPLQGAL
jgi:hypothetical protein